MTEEINVGDRVQVLLASQYWNGGGWFLGTVVKIEPYSEHRSFYWVELDKDATSMFGRGTNLISVLNPKNIKRIA
jgi:hypothetical protein